MVQSVHKPVPVEEVQKQASKVLAQFAGYVGTRTIQIGIKHGLVAALARHPEGLTADQLAQELGADRLYVNTWCRSAYAAEVLELDPGGKYTLAAHMERLLLDVDSPAFIGGIPAVLDSQEVFDSFGPRLVSGKRTWWNECGPEFIHSVSLTGRAFYSRLIPAGLQKVPGLAKKLEAGGSALELAIGAGTGLIKLARAYPGVRLVGVDGDEYSLRLAAENLKKAAVDGRVELVQSTLEGLNRPGEFDVAIINISMHECRDIEKTTRKVFQALKPGGIFVISDFPFPASVSETRTVPARIMCGIQFFEAMIDDQLLPTRAFVELLQRHGFRDVDSFDMTPVHAITFGTK